MANKVHSIDGIEFRFTKIPAVPARELLSGMQADFDVLRPYIEVTTAEGWVALDSKVTIEKHIRSWETLTTAELFAYDYNYGFLATWKPTPLPAKMEESSYRVAETKNVDAAVSALITNGMANYEQLRDTYSLEEAFKLLDVLTVKKINEFRAAEASK
jgi:hypothetical protein